jgi:LysM domain
MQSYAHTITRTRSVDVTQGETFDIVTAFEFSSNHSCTSCSSQGGAAIAHLHLQSPVIMEAYSVQVQPSIPRAITPRRPHSEGACVTDYPEGSPPLLSPFSMKAAAARTPYWGAEDDDCSQSDDVQPVPALSDCWLSSVKRSLNISEEAEAATPPLTPCSSSSSQAGSPRPVAAAFAEHTIVSGETLAGICLRYRTSARELRKLNNFSGDQFRVLQVLVVPQRASSSSSSSGASAALQDPLQRHFDSRPQQQAGSASAGLTRLGLIRQLARETGAAEARVAQCLEAHSWRYAEARASWLRARKQPSIASSSSSSSSNSSNSSSSKLQQQEYKQSPSRRAPGWDDDRRRRSGAAAAAAAALAAAEIELKALAGDSSVLFDLDLCDHATAAF